jgi:hypothetical protein
VYHRLSAAGQSLATVRVARARDSGFQDSWRPVTVEPSFGLSISPVSPILTIGNNS